MRKKDVEKISLSKIVQIGIVVKDVDKAVEYYSKKFNMGPFRVVIAKRSGALVHGKPMDYAQKIAFTQLGDIQIELMQVIEGRPIQKEFLEEKGEGLHHLCFRVEDLDAEIAKWEKQGIKCIQRSKPPGPGFAMMDTTEVGGTIFELSQPAPEEPRKS